MDGRMDGKKMDGPTKRLYRVVSQRLVVVVVVVNVVVVVAVVSVVPCVSENLESISHAKAARFEILPTDGMMVKQMDRLTPHKTTYRVVCMQQSRKSPTAISRMLLANSDQRTNGQMDGWTDGLMD